MNCPECNEVHEPLEGKINRVKAIVNCRDWHPTDEAALRGVIQAAEFVLASDRLAAGLAEIDQHINVAVDKATGDAPFYFEMRARGNLVYPTIVIINGYVAIRWPEQPPTILTPSQVMRLVSDRRLIEQLRCAALKASGQVTPAKAIDGAETMDKDFSEAV